MTRRHAMAAVLVAVAAGPARATEYVFETPTELLHRDQWGVHVTGGGMLLTVAAAHRPADTGPDAIVDLAVTRGLAGSGHELLLALRLGAGHHGGGLAVHGGYRAYAGREHAKTYADLEVLGLARPALAVGIRAAAGILYDLGRHLGLSASLGGFIAVGQGVITGADVSLGAQVRF